MRMAKERATLWAFIAVVLSVVTYASVYSIMGEGMDRELGAGAYCSVENCEYYGFDQYR